MRAIKKIQRCKENGFSVLEIAISLVMVGLVIAAIIPVYQQQRVKKNEEILKQNLADAQAAIGGFRSVYGRYPRPMQTTAVPGDLEYGHEVDRAISDAIPLGSCANGICRFASAVPGKVVLVGTMPFKKLELQETQVFDRHLNRFTYAVTEDLTVSATFDLNGGGISIVDSVEPKIPPSPPTPLVDPSDSAHFIVVTHGENKAGAFSREGSNGVPCGAGTLNEQENCDGDATFVSAEFSRRGFDDRVGFFSAVFPSEWQKAELDESVIHMKRMDSIAIGASATENLNNSEQLTVRELNPGDAIILADGHVHNEFVCEDDPSNLNDCFQTSLLTGTLEESAGFLRVNPLTPNRGVSCHQHPTATGDFLVRMFDNGQIECADEIFQTCPAGQLIARVVDGVIECEPPAEPGCPDTPAVSLCGDNTTIVGETKNGSGLAIHGTSGFHYSGECRNITNYSSGFFRSNLAGLSFGQKQAFINTINAEPRTIEDCGADPNRALVRGNFRCDAGSWQHLSDWEKRTVGINLNQPWSKANLWWTGPWPAENSHNGPDPNNTRGDHDCWCREDYRIIEAGSCPEFFTGTAYQVQKHRCPQTEHHWTFVHNDFSSCTCSPSTMTQTQSCNSYYDEVNGTTGTTGLAGQVTKTFDVTCVAGSPVTSPTPSTIDSSSCHCPANSDTITRDFCGTGLTNNWTWNGQPQIGVESIEVSEWNCPPTSTGGLPDPGFYTPATVINGPACSCNGEATSEITRVCEDGLEGTGMKYRREWICDAGHADGGYWEPEEDWELLEDNCFTCAWATPSGAPSVEGAAFGQPVGQTCACGSPAADFCHEFSVTSNYNVWNGCQCVVNP